MTYLYILDLQMETDQHIQSFGKVPARWRSGLHQSRAASSWWCGPRPCLGWVEMAVGLPEGPSYPGHSPIFFRYAAP